MRDPKSRSVRLRVKGSVSVDVDVTHTEFKVVNTTTAWCWKRDNRGHRPTGIHELPKTFFIDMLNTSLHLYYTNYEFNLHYTNGLNGKCHTLMSIINYKIHLRH